MQQSFKDKLSKEINTANSSKWVRPLFYFIVLYTIIAIIFLAVSLTAYFRTHNMDSVGVDVSSQENITVDGFYQPYSDIPRSIFVSYDENSKTSTVNSGARIYVTDEQHIDNIEHGGITQCTITVASDEYALTSGHCAYSSSSKVYVKTPSGMNSDSRFLKVGEITYVSNSDSLLGEFKGFDAAIIKFEPSVKGSSNGISDKPLENMDKVSLNGRTSDVQYGFVVNEGLYQDARKVIGDSKVIILSSKVRGGDSGGPVFNSEGKIAGIIKSRYSNGESGAVSIFDIIEKFDKEELNNLID